MNTYWAVGVGFIISLLVTPTVIKFAKNLNIVDYPDRPHPAIIHNKPIPRGGGVAVLISIFATYFFFTLLNAHLITKQLVGVFLGAGVVVVVGVLDDKLDLNPYIRLASNFLAAGVVVAFGVGITSIFNPFGGQIRFDEFIIKVVVPNGAIFGGTHSIILLADLFAFVWIAWLINALNWSSGVDGQLSGIAAIAAVTLGFVATKYLAVDPTQIPLAVLAFATAGAYLGFLPWSFYPQKIMPGYSGGALAGFLIAVLSILAGGKLAVVLIVLAVPLMDGVWAIGRRVLKRRLPVWGDREHLHHQLLNLGWKIPQIALFYYFVTIVLAAFALTLGSRGKFFAIIMIFIILLAVLITIATLNRRLKFKT